ncbi:MAG: isoprenylcysteine carboxylmethyltransferase family protein [Patescibacteria group bacterium]
MSIKKLINPPFMIFLILVGIGLIFKFTPDGIVLEKNIFTNILSLLAIVYWVRFSPPSFLVNRKALLGSYKTEKLIQSGVYKIVRHPIYSADIVLGWGIFLFWPTVIVLLSVILLDIILFCWMHLEEKVLIEKFGNDYLEYKKKVPMFLPRIF